MERNASKIDQYEVCPKSSTNIVLQVIVRNPNNEIEFATEDCRLMSSRAKGKIDILSNLVQSSGIGAKLRVIKAWTDQVDTNNLLSLHYEGILEIFS